MYVNENSQNSVYNNVENFNEAHNLICFTKFYIVDIMVIDILAQ